MQHPPGRAPDRVALQLVRPTRATCRRRAERAPSAARRSASRATGTVRTSAISPSLTVSAGTPVQHAHERHDEDPAHDRVDRRQGPDQVGQARVEPDLLLGLAQRRLDERLARILEPPGERDLAGVPRKLGRPLGEDQRGLRGEHERGQDGREPVALGRLGRRIGIQHLAESRANGRRVASRAMVEESVSRAADAAAAAVDADEVLRFARALIAAPSENPGGTEDEAAAVATEILEALDASPRTIRSEAGRPSVVAAIGSGERPRLAWNGHLDVVPAGSADTWRTGGPVGGRGRRRTPRRAGRRRHEGSRRRRARRRRRDPARRDRAGRDVRASTWPPTRSSRASTARRCCGIVACSTRTPRSWASRASSRSASPSAAAHGSRRPPSGRPRTARQPHLGVNAITSMARFLLRLHEVLPDIEHPLVGRPTVNAALIARRERAERRARPLHGRHRPAGRSRARPTPSGCSRRSSRWWTRSARRTPRS